MSEKKNDQLITSKMFFPSSRSRHTTCYQNDILYLFGGGGSYKIFDDLWCLDTKLWTWSKPKTSGDQPSARWGHSMTLIENKIYIFGGGGNQQNKMLNDLFEIDITTLIWKKVELSTKYAIPSPRAAHTATSIAFKYLLLLFGGDNTRFLGDLFIISMGITLLVK